MTAGATIESTPGARRGAAGGALALRPSLTIRIALAIGIGLVAGLLSAQGVYASPVPQPDFFVLWRATTMVLGAANPYELIVPMPGADLFQTFFAYPLPAIGLALPFVWLSPEAATVAFIGCSSALFAYAITRDGFMRLPALLSVPFVLAMRSGQTSIGAVALGILPLAGGLAVMKPNLGLALFAWCPRWRTVIYGGALLAGSVLVAPEWPRWWLASIRHSPNYHPPILLFGGVVVLLALLRWRDPGARLLVAMAVIPHALFFYDDLTLWLIPRTHRETMLLTWCSWLAYGGWFATSYDVTAQAFDIRRMGPWILWCLYVPCLVMILRRPNTPHAL